MEEDRHPHQEPDRGADPHARSEVLSEAGQGPPERRSRRRRGHGHRGSRGARGRHPPRQPRPRPHRHRRGRGIGHRHPHGSRRPARRHHANDGAPAQHEPRERSLLLLLQPGRGRSGGRQGRKGEETQRLRAGWRDEASRHRQRGAQRGEGGEEHQAADHRGGQEERVRDRRERGSVGRSGSPPRADEAALGARSRAGEFDRAAVVAAEAARAAAQGGQGGGGTPGAQPAARRVQRSHALRVHRRRRAGNAPGSGRVGPDGCAETAATAGGRAAPVEKHWRKQPAAATGTPAVGTHVNARNVAHGGTGRCSLPSLDACHWSAFPSSRSAAAAADAPVLRHQYQWHRRPPRAGVQQDSRRPHAILPLGTSLRPRIRIPPRNPHRHVPHRSRGHVAPPQLGRCQEPPIVVQRRERHRHPPRGRGLPQLAQRHRRPRGNLPPRHGRARRRPVEFQQQRHR
mmetsp:Transcript_23559/g.49354  ORF Transcript_23559/g.49354 Transcript_23559/m.49354 type:complete len:457 (-) Transcript_23559:1065-2435(-)